MAGTLVTQQTKEIDIQFASSPALPDVATMANHILSEAIAFCAAKMGVDGPTAVVNLVKQNEKDACTYCLYGIAKRVAVSLGTMDENVKAVYVHDYDATPEDICFGTLNQNTPLVHMIVWTERKTAALNSLIAALDRALGQFYADLIDKPQIKSLLDVQMVDDAEVENHVGSGALLHSIHHQPIRVWQR
ncbi:MAG: hypothetical protein JXA89_10020 [Anaerolineae bacterium]|nr:hypothetical protein [Anaerolineae bacterium]